MAFAADTGSEKTELVVRLMLDELSQMGTRSPQSRPTPDPRVRLRSPARSGSYSPSADGACQPARLGDGTGVLTQMAPAEKPIRWIGSAVQIVLTDEILP